MPNLTLAQIDYLVSQAQALGMTAYEAEGLRDALLMRTAQPGLGQKLDIAIRQLPAAQVASIDEYMAAADVHQTEILARGATYLGGLSDDEWNAIFEEGEGA